jgi:hypothetical protein
MQEVVVKVRGVCSPGLGLTTLGVVCVKAGPDAAIIATAKMILQVFMVVSALGCHQGSSHDYGYPAKHFADTVLLARFSDVILFTVARSPSAAQIRNARAPGPRAVQRTNFHHRPDSDRSERQLATA